MGTLYVMQGGSFVEQGGGTGGSSASGRQLTFDAADSTSYETVTGDGTAHTKGSWSTAFLTSTLDAETLTVTCVTDVAATGANSATLLDIGTWNGSSYDVLIANIPLGARIAGTTFTFNVAVASGTQIAGRLQSVVTSKTVDVHIGLRAAGDPSSAAPTALYTYGSDTATSAGVLLTAPGGTHTDAAWTDITMSTSAAHTRLSVVPHQASSSAATAPGLIDIGLWNGSSYDAIINNIGYSLLNTERMIVLGADRYFLVDEIPMGSRLGARYQSSTTVSNGRPNVSIIGG